MGEPNEESRTNEELRIELLGGFRVIAGGRRVPDDSWRLQKAKSLVKLLALAPGQRLPRDRAVDLLWPELDPNAANNNLYQTLHAARKALTANGGAAQLALRHGVISLCSDAGTWVDVDAFEKTTAEARRSDDVRLYREAANIYTGELLPDDLYEDWAAWRREGLRETFLGLLTELASRYEARGELNEAIETLQRAAQVDPLREEVHAELMRLYASIGLRGRAIRQFEQIREALASELEAEPDESTLKMYRAIVEGEFHDEAEDQRPAPKHNLTLPLTRFIGRKESIEEIKELIGGNRLVTLTGVGGSGKSRLALRVAWDLLDTYRDGVWRVRLASLSDERLVPRTVAGVLGVAEGPDAVTAAIEKIGSSRTLLVLDNCEHLLGECRRITIELLGRCPHLHILATSRTRFKLSGETVYPVEPLTVPIRTEISAGELDEFESVQLFVDRARQRRPAFELNDHTAAAVAEICKRVDGIPLALELAAGRVGTLGVEQIADRLQDLSVLLATSDEGVDSHHRSLAAALEWSYRLLGEPEQHLFQRLAVFEGGWNVDQGEALVADDSQASENFLDLLAGLVDKSLIAVQGGSDGSVRFRLLEPVAEFARARLQEADESELTQLRHLEVYTALAEIAVGELRGQNSRIWLDRLEIEHDNFRAAIRCALEEGHLELGLRLGAALWRFWFMRGYLREGRTLLEELLCAANHVPELDGKLMGDCENAAGALAFYQTDASSALSHYEKSLELRREVGDEKGVAGTLSNIALVLKDRGDIEQARPLFDESLELFRKLGDQRGIASTIGNLGILLQENGEFEAARPFLEESVALARSVGGQGAVLTCLNNLGALSLEVGDYPRARAILTEALTSARSIGAKRSELACLVNLGQVERRDGHPGRALECYRDGLLIAQDLGEKAAFAFTLEGLASALLDTSRPFDAVALLGAADAIRESARTPPSRVEKNNLKTLLEAGHETLGCEFSNAWESVRHRPIEDVVQEVLSEGLVGQPISRERLEIELRRTAADART